LIHSREAEAPALLRSQKADRSSDGMRVRVLERQFDNKRNPMNPTTLPGSEEFGNRVRFSRLKLMAKSPAHFAANPQGDTSALDRGTAVHSAILGGKRVTFYPELTAAGKSAPRNGAKWDAFQAANPDALILSRSEYDETARIVEAVQAHKDAMFLLGGTREETIHFDMMGLECRTTPDARQPGIVAELKTCRTSDPRRFSTQSLWLWYHAQCAFHAEGIRRAKLDAAAPQPFIVAVETSVPYPVTIFKLTPRAVEQGMKSVRLWLEQLKGCLASNQWPAYAQSYVDLDVPDPDAGLTFATPAEDIDF
jgi:PDDEXK-like domain of unknown function (DUF3799)